MADTGKAAGRTLVLIHGLRVTTDSRADFRQSWEDVAEIRIRWTKTLEEPRT